jgi:hypothetical protein
VGLGQLRTADLKRMQRATRPPLNAVADLLVQPDQGPGWVDLRHQPKKKEGLDGGIPITEAIVTRQGGDVPPEWGKRGTAPRAQHVVHPEIRQAVSPPGRRDPGGSARICRGGTPGPLPCGRAHLIRGRRGYSDHVSEADPANGAASMRSSFLTPRWRKPDSNRRYRATPPTFRERLMSRLLDSPHGGKVGANENRNHEKRQRPGARGVVRRRAHGPHLLIPPPRRTGEIEEYREINLERIAAE